MIQEIIIADNIEKRRNILISFFHDHLNISPQGFCTYKRLTDYLGTPENKAGIIVINGGVKLYHLAEQ